MVAILILMVTPSLACLGISVSEKTFDYGNIAVHPRLLLGKGEEERVKSFAGQDAVAGKVHAAILAESERMLSTAPVRRIKEGKRLLAVSRTALQRVFYLSYSYRMTGDTRYADRARREMLAACSFSDWNPAHFLDVGEMTMAVAIGYDWLYDYLSDEDKSTVEMAILEKGLDPAKNKKYAWFYGSENNWNQVCNAGLVYGALAIYEKNPEEAEAIIEKAIATNRPALESYAPDGGYPEGFGYWGYGTSFQIMMNAALETSLGSDAGLGTAPGFLRSAYFVQFMTAPSGECFCFSDANSMVLCNMMMFWCASKLKDDSLVWLERKYIMNMPENFSENLGAYFAEPRLLPVLPVFLSGLGTGKPSVPRKRFWLSGGSTPVFVYRSGWKSSEDTYLGVKGGSASTSHAHMDAGSFVYEKNGVRWAMDLGSQSYITLESKGVDLWNMRQNSQRWDVFRLGNMAHSTLTLNGEKHKVDAFAPIVEVYKEKKKKGASVDLTDTFGNLTAKTLRTVALDRKDNLVVTDWIENKDEPLYVTWVMVTSAIAEVTGRNQVTLFKDGRRMSLEVVSGQDVEMFVVDNEPPHDYDFNNPGTCRVGYKYTLRSGRAENIKVVLKSF